MKGSVIIAIYGCLCSGIFVCGQTPTIYIEHTNDVVKANLREEVDLTCKLENIPASKKVRWEIVLRNNGKIKTIPLSKGSTVADASRYRISVENNEQTYIFTILSMKQDDEAEYVCRAAINETYWLSRSVHVQVKANCSNPPEIANGSREFTTTISGSHANYTCNTGFSISGDPNILCHDDGMWEPVPTCSVVKCSRDLCSTDPNSLCEDTIEGGKCVCKPGYTDEFPNCTYDCEYNLQRCLGDMLTLDNATFKGSFPSYTSEQFPKVCKVYNNVTSVCLADIIPHCTIKQYTDGIQISVIKTTFDYLCEDGFDAYIKNNDCFLKDDLQSQVSDCWSSFSNNLSSLQHSNNNLTHSNSTENKLCSYTNDYIQCSLRTRCLCSGEAADLIYELYSKKMQENATQSAWISNKCDISAAYSECDVTNNSAAPDSRKQSSTVRTPHDSDVNSETDSDALYHLFILFGVIVFCALLLLVIKLYYRNKEPNPYHREELSEIV